MAKTSEETTTWEEFVRAVRRWKPSEVSATIGRVSARLARDDQPLVSPLLPWALNAVATVSVVLGNEYGREGLTERELAGLCDCYNRLRAPRDLVEGSEGALGAFLFRTGYEQFPYQRRPHYELGRPLALLDPPVPPEGLKVSGNDWRSAFGASIEELVAAGFVLVVGTQVNDGRFDLAWIDQPQFRAVRQAVSGEAIQDTVESVFTADVEDIRRRWFETEALFPEVVADPELRRYLPSPLLETPLVRSGKSPLIAPVVQNVLRRLSPEGLYYAARGAFGEDFSLSLGPLFEAYVGRQFGAIPRARVWPEVLFGNSQRSVDWFVELDGWLLLVEAKATRMPVAARAGREEAVVAAIDRTLGKAARQITKSAELIRADRAEFRHLPSHLPMLGIAVTLEPYYMSHVRFSPSRPTADIPFCSLPISDVELLVAVGQATLLGEPLAHVASGEDLVREIWQLPRRRNPVIAESWGRLPFGLDDDG